MLVFEHVSEQRNGDQIYNKNISDCRVQYFSETLFPAKQQNLGNGDDECSNGSAQYKHDLKSSLPRILPYEL